MAPRSPQAAGFRVATYDGAEGTVIAAERIRGTPWHRFTVAWDDGQETQVHSEDVVFLSMRTP